MKQIAIVADMHGNWPATQALAADLNRRGIREIYCLGDMIGKGPSSKDTMRWTLENCQLILRGNWEEGIGLKQYPKDEFYYEQLGEEYMAMLPEFPMEHCFILSGRRIRMIHGRPLLSDAVGVHREESYFQPLLENHDVLIYADAHKIGMRLMTGGKMVINCGSVGNGLNLNMVQYAILTGDEEDASAPFDVNLITLPYDNRQAAQDALDAEKQGLVKGDLFAKEVLTGVYARHPKK